MTKTYKINGKEILGVGQHFLQDQGVCNETTETVLENLLEALDEKKEESELCTCDIHCYNGVNINNCAYKPHHSKEEPKSTLRDEITNSLRGYPTIRGIEIKLADKIISLFKDTLLKEMEQIDSKYDDGNETTHPGKAYFECKGDIINLIKIL